MERNRKRLISYGLTLLFTSGAALFFSMGLEDGVFILFLLANFFVYLSARSDNIFHVFWLLGFFSFIFNPFFAIYPISTTAISVEIVLASVIFSSLAFFITANWKLDFSDQSLSRVNMQITLLILYSIISFGGFSGMLSFGLTSNFLFVFLISLLFYFVRVCGKFVSAIMVAIYITILVLYSVILWSGFGRLNIAVWLITAAVIFLQRFGFGFSKLLVLFASVVGPGMLEAVRGRGGLKEQFLSGYIDSNLSPILLATSFFEHGVGKINGFLDLLGQFALLFFAFVPRSVWPSKPYGFGFEYTLRELSDSLVEAGHSVAGLFMGDHMYFLGSIGIFTSVFSVIAVCITYVITSRSTRFHLLSGLVAMQLPTFIWNGIGSFSQRLMVSIFGYLAALAIFYLLRRLLRLNRVRVPNLHQNKSD